MPSRPAELDHSADSLIFTDDGQPLVEVARALDDGQPLVEIARSVLDGGYKGEGMDEWEFATTGGGRTVGAGQVTEIIERVAETDDFIIIDIIDDLRVSDGGFVFGETMYFE